MVVILLYNTAVHYVVLLCLINIIVVFFSTLMLLSLKSEMVLKRLINSQNKKQEIDKLSVIIESTHEQNAATFATDYPKVIEKCNTLQELNSHLEAHNKNCLDIIDAIRNAHLRQSTISEQYDRVVLSINNLNKIQYGIIQFYDFLKEVRKLNTTQDIYESVKIIRAMEEKKGYLKKYNFYCQLNEIYIRSKTQFTTRLEKQASMSVMEKDFILLGKGIKSQHSCGIFQELARWRREIMGPDFFKIVFATKKLDIEDKISSKVSAEFFIHLEKMSNDSKKEFKNSFGTANNYDGNKGYDNNKSNDKEIKRKNTYQDTYQDNFVYFAMAALVFDNCLAESFDAYHSHSNKILKLLKTVQIHDIRTLVPLKHVITELMIDVSELSTIVESATYSFFNKDIERDNFYKRMSEFIYFSCQFLNEMSEFSDELGEILAKRTDVLLLERLHELYTDKESNSRLCEIIISTNTVLAQLLNKQISLVYFDFKVRAELDRIVSGIIDAECDKIQIVFETRDVEEVVKAILKLRNFLTTEYRLILIEKIKKNINLWAFNFKKDDLVLIEDTIIRNF